MRVAFPAQNSLDTIAIPQVVIKDEGRHPIIPILVALQHLYADQPRRQRLMDLIAQDINRHGKSSLGRPGMTYWQILVLTAVRLGCNFEYDLLQELAQEHTTLRRLLGLGTWDDEQPEKWDYRQIRDNLCKIRPETLAQINALVVDTGHEQANRPDLKVRGDSFVCETNIHYPTDASVLCDGLRKILTLAAVMASLLGLPGWRQVQHWHKALKRLLRDLNQACKSKKKGAVQRRRRAYYPLLKKARKLLKRARLLEQTVQEMLARGLPGDLAVACQADLKRLGHFLVLTEQVVQQAHRRVMQGETIANLEKILSVFEPHTEIICKGKAGAPVQWGRQVLVLEDQLGFIVHYQLLERGQRDQDVGTPALQEAQAKVDNRIRSASFDRGFHSPLNQEELAKIVAQVCVPKRGPKQAAEQEATATPEFLEQRRRHSGVESSIHALQSGNGLLRCRDRSERGLERYLGMAVLGRNLQVLGRLLLGHKRRTGPNRGKKKAG